VDVERFSMDRYTFTPGMAKRPGQGPFDAAPIVQGQLDGPPNDVLITETCATVGNVVAATFKEFIDLNQGTIVFWITPEWDGDDGIRHELFWLSGSAAIEKMDTNVLRLVLYGSIVQVDVSAWAAGTTYFVAFRWDFNHTLDGTNYASITVDAADTFGMSTAPTLGTPASLLRIGAFDATHVAGNPSAIIEGLTVFRRVLYDGTYGTPPLDGTDELAAIYAAGAGADPSQVVKGSWDTVFCLPTNCATGALVTGTGEAWSHPHDSELLDVTFMSDGDPPGTPYAVEFANGDLDCGSGATLDDIPVGVHITLHGWIRPDGDAFTVSKGDGTTVGWLLEYDEPNERLVWRVALVTTDMTAYSDTGSLPMDGKWHHFSAYWGAASKSGQVAVDGAWGTANVGVGNYISDAAQDFVCDSDEVAPMRAQALP
jgi:hypothetical protein